MITKNEFQKELYECISEIVKNSRFKNELKEYYKNYINLLFNERTNAIAPLTDRETEIIKRKYLMYNKKTKKYEDGEGETFQAIGEDFKITKSRTQQIFVSALKKCKKYLQESVLQYEENLYRSLSLSDIFDKEKLPLEIKYVEAKEKTNINQLLIIEKPIKKNLVRNIILVKLYILLTNEKSKLNKKELLIIKRIIKKHLDNINLECLFMSNHTYFCLYSKSIRTLGDLVEADEDILSIADFSTIEDRKELSKYIHTSADAISKERFRALNDTESRKIKHLLNSTISDLGLSLRTFNALKRASIYKVEQLLFKTPAELMKELKIGKRAAEEVATRINEIINEPYNRINDDISAYRIESLELTNRTKKILKNSGYDFLGEIVGNINNFLLTFQKDKRIILDIMEYIEKYFYKYNEKILKIRIENLNISETAINSITSIGCIYVEDVIATEKKKLLQIKPDWVICEFYKRIIELQENINIENKRKNEMYNQALIDDTNLSLRLKNALKREGITTVGELLTKTEEELKRIKSIGKIGFQQLKEFIIEYQNPYSTNESEFTLLRKKFDDKKEEKEKLEKEIEQLKKINNKLDEEINKMVELNDIDESKKNK